MPERGGDDGRTSTGSSAPISVAPCLVNANPALLVRLDGDIDGVMAIRVEDARIAVVYYVRNPDKLSRVESETSLTRR